MTSSIITTIASASGGLCCCLFWIGLLLAAFWFFMRRGKGGDDGSAAKAAIDQKIASDVNMAADKKAATPEPAMATTGPAESEDAEDAATVIAPQPPKGDMPAATPPKAAPPKPAPRVSGATIIAFDDDLADDE